MKKQALILVLISEREHQCERCGRHVWLNSKIPLELHHKDGNHQNNNKDNLELLCPNCHAQTDNYRSKNNKRTKSVSDEEILSEMNQCSNVFQILTNLNMAGGEAQYARIYQLAIQYGFYNFLETSSLKQEDKSKRKRRKRAKKNRCIDCGAIINRRSSRCIKCAHKIQSKCTVTRAELKNLIRTSSFLAIAKEYDVSDNAVRKWCKSFDLPYKSSDIRLFTDEEWEQEVWHNQIDNEN